MPKIHLNVKAPHTRRRWRPWMKWTAYGVGALVTIMALLFAYYYPKAKPAIAAARQAQSDAKQLSTHVSQQRFSEAKEDVQRIQVSVDTIDRQLQRMQGLRSWPYVGRQYRAAVDLLAVGQDSTMAVGSLVDFMAHLFEPFAGRGKISLASITREEKGKLLANIATREESLRAAQTSIHRAETALEKIPAQGLIAPLQRVVTPLKQQFPIITQALDQAIPATHLLPPLLGYPNQKTYLFLLQNNTELRPGGGFIGTYGLMKVSSGEIVSLKTDNSYNLDEAAKKLPPIEPPAPLRTYLKQNAWYFRDSNWSPDFPTSAGQALLFYQREGGSRNVDGVMAVTPTTISALLRLVGPIKVGDIEFTADTFTEKLQAYVDKGFKSAGQSESQRKDIIGIMTKDLVDRLLKLPVAEWKDVFLVLSQQLSEKQLLLYMKDTGVQGILVDQNWAGAIDRTPEIDSLMVVDANLASLKTDLAMRRTYTSTVDLTGERPTVELVIRYQHTGKFDWRTSYLISRYNTYIRVYVPSGSELVSSSGAQRRERSNAAGEVQTSSELGKTVFAAFKSIEPGTSSELKLVYRLPAVVGRQLQQNQYRLVWQKQPGMEKTVMNLTIKTDRQPQRAEGLDNQARFSHSSLSFSGPLFHDRDIVVHY